MGEIVKVATQYGWRTVECEPVGSLPFVVHEDILEGSDGYTLTHRATGYSVASGYRDKASLLRLAQAITPLADWGFRDPQRIRIWPTPLRDALRGMVRSFRRDSELRLPTRDGDGGRDG